jgi:hypothetical protein
MVNNSIKSKCKGSSRSKCGIVLLATGGLLISFSTWAAQEYPVSGVWIATNSGRFPGTIMGACFALKSFGLDGALHQPFPELMIFSGSKRFEVRDDREIEATIRSVRNTLGGTFRITESLGRRGKWLPWSERSSFNLEIIEPTIIDIAKERTITRFAKCAAGRPDL